MIDTDAVTAFANGLGLGLFSFVAIWGFLVVIHFFKSLLNGVMP